MLANRTLVAYFSKGGAAETYAGIVADVLREHGFQVDLVDLRQTKVSDLSGYDNIVLGTGVRIGLVYRKAKKFLRRKDLEGKRLAIFLASGIAVEDAAESKRKFLDPLVEKYGLETVRHDPLPGKIPVGGGELEDRTDPELACRWAEDLARALSG